jgi:hypothetical protein
MALKALFQWGLTVVGLLELGLGGEVRHCERVVEVVVVDDDKKLLCLLAPDGGFICG